jgi:hypothetical protein
MKTLYRSALRTIITPAPGRESLRPMLGKLKRPAGLILAVFVAALFMRIPPALAQTIYEGMPNGAFFSFTLAPGASTGPIQLPLNVPWHISGAVTTLGNEGVGEVEIISGIVSGEPFLEWIGLNSWETSTISSGVSSSAARIVTISFQGDVVIAASSTTSTFVVANTSATLTNTGYVTWTGLGMAILAPSNTALGTAALQSYIVNNYSGTGTNNTATGYQALYSDTGGTGSQGSYNTASGANALYSNTTGSNNTASGSNSLSTNASGSNNTANGENALESTTGGNSTAVGTDALVSATTGSGNIALGYQAGMDLTTGSDNIEIGNVGAAGDDKVIKIGQEGTQKKTVIAGIYGNTAISGLAVVIGSNGELGAVSSSERFKSDIAPMGSNTAKLQQLRPVTFQYKADPQGTLRYGLIAEEVATVYPELVVRDQNGRIDGVRYDELTPMLLNEMQQQQQRVSAQDRRAAAQDATIAAQAAEIRELKQQLKQFATRSEVKELKQQLQAAPAALQAKDQLIAQR